MLIMGFKITYKVTRDTVSTQSPSHVRPLHRVLFCHMINASIALRIRSPAPAAYMYNPFLSLHNLVTENMGLCVLSEE
jgi:hypothetical protein